ncbi:MAG TPA: polysaccharide deacetylase family protein [Solirubrobacteraceae bacterium]|nr:polysaccharide deacetylase family protein [Solirubrobacteraceae bacterium]
MNRTVAPGLLPTIAGIAAALLVALLVLGSADGRDAGAAHAVANTAAVSRQAVPILMYHALRTAPAGTRSPALFVRPREFAAQVRALRRSGYRAVTLQRVWDAWHGRAKLPRKPVVFSFDDGYESQVRVALPLLRRERWPGVLNLALDWVDDLGGDDAVRRLIAAGWQIDGHSSTHPDLTRVPAARLADETAGARAELQARFGVPVNFFAYPSGRYDTRVVAAVRDAGYLAATTVRRGLARPGDPYALARLQVSGGLGAAGLLRRLRELR